jgi:hypothetical protein
MLSNNQFNENKSIKKTPDGFAEFNSCNNSHSCERAQNKSSMSYKLDINSLNNIEDHEVKIYSHKFLESDSRVLNTIKSYLKFVTNKPIPVKFKACRNLYVIGLFEADDNNRFNFKLALSSYDGTKNVILDSNSLDFILPNPGSHKLAELTDFSIVENNDSLLIFLVVYSYVYIIKFNTVVFEEEILFRRDFQTSTPLLLLKSELVRSNSEYNYYLVNRDNDGKLFHIITYDLNSKNGVGCTDKDISFLLLNNNIKDVNRYSVSNGLIYFNETLSETFYSINIKSNKVAKLATIKDISDNYLVLHRAEVLKAVPKDQVYVVKDEVTNESLVVSLYRLGQSENELIQSITIKSDGNAISEYNIHFIEGTEYIAVTFYETDSVYLFKLGVQNNTNEGLVYFEDIYSLQFEDLSAWLVAYRMSNDNLSILICRNDFIMYEVDLKSLTHYTLQTSKDNLSAESKYVTPFDSKENCSKTNNKTNMISNKDDITNNIVNALEDKLNDFISKKMEKFSEDMNNKLTDTLSFFKRQSEVLDDNRRKNNETINKIIALIGMKNQNPMALPINIPLRTPMNPNMRPWVPNVEMNNKFSPNNVNPVKTKEPSPKKGKKLKLDDNNIFEAALIDKEISKIEPIIYCDNKERQEDYSSESSGYISDEEGKNMINNLNNKVSPKKGIPAHVLEKIKLSKSNSNYILI